MTKDEYHKVLNNIAGSFGTLKDQVNQAFDIGRGLGLTDSQIGSDVRTKIKGLVSISTIQRMLPDTAKHQHSHIASEKSVKLTAANPNRRLVVPEEPSLPPPAEVVREAEIVKEPPKPINEPIAIPTPKPYIIFRQKQWRDKYNWDTSHTLKLVLDNTRENIIDVRPMMEAKK